MIDIIKTRPYMTYPDVAFVVVQLNLKGKGSPNKSDGFSLLDHEGESCFDESNLATSARKKAAVAVPAEENLETPARRRSRQEANLRRRIYDAWNVLKAASIIVEHDDKNFMYNPSTLEEDDVDTNNCANSNAELIKELIHLTAKGPVNHTPQQSSDDKSQTFNQARGVSTNFSTNLEPANGNSPTTTDLEREAHHLEQLC